MAFPTSAKYYFFIFIISHSILVSFAYIRLYSPDNEEFELKVEDCDQGVIELFTPRQFTCACVKGIFSLFGERCSKPLMTLGGSHHCFPIEDATINRIEFVNKALRPSFTILERKTKYVRARYNRSTEYPSFRKGDHVIAVESWTLIKKDGSKVCLQVPEHSYCLYQKLPKFVAMKSGCHEHGNGKTFFPFSECKPIMEPNDFLNGCQNQHHHHIQKRAPQVDSTTNTTGQASAPANTTDQASSPANTTNPAAAVNGNTTIPGAAGANGTNNATTGSLVAPPTPAEADEDFGVESVSGSDIVKAQIYSYVAERGASVLNLGSLSNSTRVYKTPVYQILLLAKEVIKMTCPKFYVSHEHWDMTVASFIAMQQKNFRFRETLIPRDEMNRIKSALMECAGNSTIFPFIDPLSETCLTAPNGSSYPTVVEDGSFIKYNERQVMNVDWGSSSRHTEPITESVWKIFVHVHSQCYEFFKDTRYNDHHRFTTILLPLFTNDIFDIWTKDNSGAEYRLEKGAYAGLLGDAWKLMDNVDYCSLSARLESSYPWDLPRPTKKTVPPVNLRRKKRELLNPGIGVCSELGRGSELC